VEYTLAIVDDDNEIRELLTDLLNQYGYKTFSAASGAELYQLLQKEKIDLIVLDIRMPGEDGFSICQNIRKTSNIPIIMLTANGEDMDRIIGLEMGADDYLPKPFNPRELVARIKAVLRRSIDVNEMESTKTGLTSEIYKFQGWMLETATRKLISPDNLTISITAGEYTLLITFLERPRRILSRDQLLEITHNRQASPFDRSIDIQVSRLRQKIEEDPKEPKLIKTVRGGGYMLTAPVEKALSHE